jgi:hypothetical protein
LKLDILRAAYLSFDEQRRHSICLLNGTPKLLDLTFLGVENRFVAELRLRSVPWKTVSECFLILFPDSAFSGDTYLLSRLSRLRVNHPVLEHVIRP